MKRKKGLKGTKGVKGVKGVKEVKEVEGRWGQDLRRRMVEGLKPVDKAIIGNPPGVPIFEILKQIDPDLIALGYDQKHSIDAIREGLDQHGFEHVEVTRVKGLSDDLDGTRKIIARILDLWPGTEGGPYEED